MKDRFKELRKKLNVTQQEFADKLKISRNFVAQIEIGNKVPSDRTIDDVCKEFNVREEWLKDACESRSDQCAAGTQSAPEAIYGRFSDQEA